MYFTINLWPSILPHMPARDERERERERERKKEKEREREGIGNWETGS